MAGIIFAKFTVPMNRGQTIVFSKNAVISMRNGALYLMCRITDLRRYSLVDARVQVRPISVLDFQNQGDPDWANFRSLGHCLLWSVF
jgi:hypothetical protein